jgi:isoleucyl-tRNA synthetase
VRGRLRADSKQLLDRYLLGKTRALVEGVTESLDAYDIPGATALVTEFLDALNNWYIRRSRPRFWRTGDDQDKRDAYDTLVTVLETLCRLCAPLLPLLAEEVWRGLTGGRSVHLADWPDAKALPAERDLVAAMDRVREVCSVGLSLREAHKLRTRLPLQSFTLAGARSEELAPYAELLRDELNVKEVRFARRIDDYGTFAVQLNMKVLGPRLGESLKGVLAAQKQGRWRLLEGGRAEVGSVELAPGEFTMRLQPKPGLACAALPGGEAVVALDVNVTPELQEEGIARDVVRLVQQARKDAGLAISDWIWVHLNLPEAFAAAVRKHERYLAEQTLADRVAYGPLPPAAFRSEGKVEGQAVAVGVERRSG